ncbi:MAG: hypothetical protein PHY05_08130 [Methanothrix sp.]|nr:hypothetical protein [Methanothrix sp.]
MYLQAIMASVRFRSPLAAVLVPAGALAGGRVPGAAGQPGGRNPGAGGRARSGLCWGSGRYRRRPEGLGRRGRGAGSWRTLVKRAWPGGSRSADRWDLLSDRERGH